MKPDLESLEISKGELKRLTNYSDHEYFVWSFLIYSFLFWMAAFFWVPFAFPNLLLKISVQLYFLMTIVLSLLSVFKLFSIFNRNFERNHRSLINLLREVENFNGVVKAIHIRDQLEEVNPTEFDDEYQREELIDTLKLIRANLVRTLQVERILRDNEELIRNSPELFSINELEIVDVQPKDRVSNNGGLRDKIAQIASSVQEESDRLKQYIQVKKL